MACGQLRCYAREKENSSEKRKRLKSRAKSPLAQEIYEFGPVPCVRQRKRVPFLNRKMCRAMSESAEQRPILTHRWYSGSVSRVSHPKRRLLRRHTHGAVESNHLSVQHFVLDDVLHQCRILIGSAQAGRERDLLPKRDARRFGKAGE